MDERRDKLLSTLERLFPPSPERGRKYDWRREALADLILELEKQYEGSGFPRNASAVLSDAKKLRVPDYFLREVKYTLIAFLVRSPRISSYAEAIREAVRDFRAPVPIEEIIWRSGLGWRKAIIGLRRFLIEEEGFRLEKGERLGRRRRLYLVRVETDAQRPN
ncbi:MAG: hypothetical protein NZ992_00145 [Candidatus Korarchaeum sp.]|nr:hypothetical protein [Candidatus Korarchaeum sp.]MDW8093331.1 hypothetical protein [Nitrososphaerota archaeon]